MYFHSALYGTQLPIRLFSVSKKNAKKINIIIPSGYYLTQKNGYAYYDYDYQQTLYKINLLDKTKEKISENEYKNLGHLVNHENNIYLVGKEINSEKGVILKIDHLTGKIEKIAEAEVTLKTSTNKKNGAFIYKNTLYYRNKGDLEKYYKIDLNNFNKTSPGIKLSDTPATYTHYSGHYKNKLFIPQSKKTHIINLDTNEEIIKDPAYLSIRGRILFNKNYIGNGKLFYEVKNGIMCIDIDTLETESVIFKDYWSKTPYLFYVDDSYIYTYSNQVYGRNETGIKKININNFKDFKNIYSGKDFGQSVDKVYKYDNFILTNWSEFDINSVYESEPALSEDFISDRFFSKKPLSKISVNVDANIPEKTGYNFYLGENKGGPFYELDKLKLDGKNEINVEKIFGRKINSFYYKIVLERFEKSTDLIPVINKIEILDIEKPKIFPNTEYTNVNRIKITGKIRDPKGSSCEFYSKAELYNPLETISVNTFENSYYVGGCSSTRPMYSNTCNLKELTQEEGNYIVTIECLGRKDGRMDKEYEYKFKIPKKEEKSNYKNIDEAISVTPSDGEFIFQENLMSAPSVGPDYNLDIISRSLVGYNGVLGKNFDHNYNKYLKINPDESVIYHDGNLNDIKFKKENDSYNRKIKATLHKNTENCEYEIKYLANAGNLCFNSNNNSDKLELSYIEDNFGNKLNLQYDEQDKLKYVKDNENRTYSYFYNDAGLLDTVTSFSVKEGGIIFDDEYYKKVTFSYNGDKLTKIIKDNSKYNYEKFILEDGRKLDFLENIELSNQLDYSLGKQKFPVDEINAGNLEEKVKTLDFVYGLDSNQIEQIRDYRNNVIVDNIYDENNRIWIFNHGYNQRKFDYILDEKKQYIKNTFESKPGFSSENMIRYDYDEKGNLLSEKSFKGHYSSNKEYLDKTDYDYNKYDELIKINYFNGNFEEFVYDDNGDGKQDDKDKGLLTHYYKGKGNIKKLVKKLEYSSDLLVKENYKSGYIAYDYNSSNSSLQQKITHSDYINKENKTASYEVIENYKYYSNGTLEREKIGDEFSYNYKYDNYGNLLSKSIGSTKVEAYRNNLFGGILEYAELDIKGEKEQKITKYKYDFFDNLKEEKSPEGKTVFYKYDNNDNLREKNNSGKEIKYAYDLLNNRVFENKFSLDKKLSYFNTKTNLNFEKKGKIGTISKYDFVGNLIETQEFPTDRNGIAFCNNGFFCLGKNLDELIKENIDNSSNLKTEYKYDKNNNLIKKIDPEKNITEFRYDEIDRLVRKIDPDGSYQVYFYNDTDDYYGDKIIKTRYYDKDSKLAQTQIADYYLDGKKIFEGYKDEVNNKNFITWYSFDKFGNLEREDYPSGDYVNYTYDYFNRLKTEKDNSGIKKTYNYDNFGNLNQILIEDDNKDIFYSTSYVFNKDNQITNKFVQSNDSKPEDIYYIYDEDGRLIKETKKGGEGESDILKKYEYDDVDRKIKEEIYEGYDVDNSHLKSRISYTYSGIDLEKIDILKKIDCSSGNGCFETNEITEYKYDEYGRLLSEDKNGDIKSHYNYDNFGKLSSITFNGNDINESSKIEYEYDKLGRIKTKKYSEKEKISTNSLLTSSIGKSLEPGENIEKLGFFYNIYDTFSKRPRSSLALIGISLAIIFSWYWFFGVLSLYWAINDIKNKATYLLEPVEESEFPGLFWMIVLMYFVLGSYVLLNSFNMI